MSGYDSAITIFSPDGKLAQVEYAMKAVEHGNVTAAMVCRDGIVFAVHKPSNNKLVKSTSIKKIHQIDHHIIAAYSGLNSDGRILINKARVEAQSYKLNFADDPSIDYIAKFMSNYIQKFTQKGGSRPFGIGIFIAGMDHAGKPKLYHIQPSGLVTLWKAHAIGYNFDLIDFLEKTPPTSSSSSRRTTPKTPASRLEPSFSLEPSARG